MKLYYCELHEKDYPKHGSCSDCLQDEIARLLAELTKAQEEKQTALANQRRQFGIEFDEISLELQDVRKKAKARIVELEKDVNYWKEYKGEDCEGCSDRDAQLEAYADAHGADEARIKELELTLSDSYIKGMEEAAILADGVKYKYGSPSEGENAALDAYEAINARIVELKKSSEEKK